MLQLVLSSKKGIHQINKKEEQTLNINLEFKTKPKSAKGTCTMGKQGVKKKD